MDIRSLKLKNKLLTENGEEYIDLSEPSMKQGAQVKIKGVYVVTEETEMRPDLIAYKFYGDEKYIDIICKANNIFNPFSIEKGQVLVIPDFNADTQVFSQPGQVNKKDLRQRFSDNARLSTKDKDRIERIKEEAKGKKKGVKQPLPPNMLQPGDASKIIKDGSIILGANLNNSNK